MTMIRAVNFLLVCCAIARTCASSRVKTTKAPVASPKATSAFNDAAAIDILSRVNALRAQRAGTPPVVWDPALAASARGWADRLAEADVLSHSSLPFGENVAIVGSTANANAGAVAVAMWYSEAPKYNGSERSAPHYTQLVWASTVRIGAGASINARGDRAYVVMEFDPPGNFRGQFASNVRPYRAQSPKAQSPKAQSPPIPRPIPYRRGRWALCKT